MTRHAIKLIVPALCCRASRKEGRLGRQASRSLALRLASYHHRNAGLVLVPGAWRALIDLKDAVAEGGASLEDVRRWFAERLMSALTHVKTRGDGRHRGTRVHQNPQPG